MKKIILTLTVILILTFIKTENSHAQTCTTTPPTNTGRVTLPAEGYTAGTYKVWSRMKAADATNNSFYIQIDSTCPVLVENSSTSWAWVANQTNVTLTAGNHVITIIGNEPGVGVDKILLTKNLSCIPDNTIPAAPNNFAGTNCPVELPATPTSTPSDTTPPIISNIVTPTITNNSATIAWNLSEGGTGQIEYGTTTNYGSVSVLETGFLTFHSQNISNLTPGTLYHYRIKSKDAANNLATSADRTFTTTGGITPTTRPSNTPTPTNIPTSTPTPVVTATPEQTVLKFNTVKLHGIGTGGDNTNPTITGNTNPITQTKVLTVELFDSAGVFVKSVQGNIVYGAGNGYFSGSIILDSSVIAEKYLVKVKTDKYLRRQLSEIITIVKGTTMQMPEVSLVVGDSNSDGALSILDYNIILDCYSDFVAPKNCADQTKKSKADLSDDGKVNHDDLTLFLRELSVVTGD